MLSDRELWAIATYLDDHLGDQTPFFITERMVTLSEQGDEDGVVTWQGISDRYDMLTGRRPHQTE
jgi:hypothetical protein